MVLSNFFTILEDYSKHVWVVMLKFKSEASDKVKSFIHMEENQFEKKVKAIRSDNSPEFLLKEYYIKRVLMFIHQNKTAELR